VPRPAPPVAQPDLPDELALHGIAVWEKRRGTALTRWERTEMTAAASEFRAEFFARFPHRRASVDLKARLESTIHWYFANPRAAADGTAYRPTVEWFRKVMFTNIPPAHADPAPTEDSHAV
jgi:hypothetical protein